MSDIFPAANRMQRAAFDLLGVRASGAEDNRQWLRHTAWPAHEFPLRKAFDAAATYPSGVDRYPFVQVRGDGVHEIPVGPVHAGTIESGHFRFSVVGERVLRLEERLGVQAQGHREALRSAEHPGRRASGWPCQRRFDRRLRLGLLHGGGGRRVLHPA